MLIHRDKSTHAPRFFTGQSGCFCCASSSYHIRQYENDSGMALLAQQSDNRTCRGLRWDGTNLVAIYNSGSGPYTRAITYDSSLATVRTTTHTYNVDNGGPSPGVCRSTFLCGDGTYCMTASRTAADNESAVASVNADNTLDWEKNYGSFPDTHDSYCVVGDGSGNVYAAVVLGSTGAALIKKYNSSGTLQWTSSTSTMTPRLITIAADGYIWMSGSTGGKLVRCTTAGTSTTLVTGGVSVDFLGNLEADQSNGVWVGTKTTTPTWEIRNYDSSGTLGTTITESNLSGPGVVAFAVDSSDNVYGLIKDGTTWKVKKWNSSGTAQWTSGDIGWPSGGTTPGWIAVDADYIFVGGGYVA